MTDFLKDLPLGPGDLQLAALLRRMGAPPDVQLAAALAGAAVGQGHVCFDVHHPADALGTLDAIPAPDRPWPEPDLWIASLASSPFACPTSAGPPDKPLALDGQGRVYLARYWDYQRRLAHAILARPEPDDPDDPDATRDAEDRTRALFPDDPGGPGSQLDAALAIVRKPLALISGGPGTGKTYTVARALAALRAANPRLRLAMAAPTGKAADRMNHSFATHPDHGQPPPAATTLHKLLGAHPASSRCRHGPANPLPVDLLAIDEASMIDLPLLAKTVEALPRHARLILVGDKDQLPPVQAGAAFADLCAAADLPGPLHGALATIATSRRTGSRPILDAADAIRRADTDAALHILRHSPPALAWRDIPARDPARAIADALAPWAAQVARAETPQDALRILARCRALCALREGPCGAAAINRAMARRAAHNPHGTPIIITRNDPHTSLSNGNTGVLWNAPAGPRAHFPDHPDIPASRLPEHEPAYAITIHKSQGSEFDRAIVVLGDRDSPVLTRELVYTALTRARESAEVWASPTAFSTALARPAHRHSGLRSLLAPTPPAIPRANGRP